MCFTDEFCRVCGANRGIQRLRYNVSPESLQCILQVSGNTLQHVEDFKYLGVIFTSDGRRNKEIDTHIGKQMQNSVSFIVPWHKTGAYKHRKVFSF